MSKTNGSIGASIWRFLGVMALVACVAWVWNYFFVARPQTVGSTVVSSLESADTPMEDATTFLNVNYWKNSDNSGKELLEVGFTSFANQTSTTTITQGLQCYDGVKTNGKSYEIYSRNMGYTEFYRTLKKRYITTDVSNIAYFDITQIDDEHSTAIISMSDAQTLDKSNFILNTHQKVTTTQNNQEVTTEKITPISLKFKTNDSGLFTTSTYDWALFSYHTNEYYTYAGIDNFMLSMQESVKSLDAGTHYIYIDLSDWFGVYLYNPEKQDYSLQTADIQYTYVLMKVTVQNQGVTRDSQSMFGKIAQEDGSFDFSQSDSTPFWKYINNYTITEEDFTLVDYNNGKMLVLDSELVDYLKNFRNLQVIIELDLDELQDVVALNAISLSDLHYKQIVIGSSTAREFTIKYGLNLNADIIVKAANITLHQENCDIPVEVI